MAEVTRNDIINEVLEKLEPIKKYEQERGKRFFENLAVITSISVILLSVLLYRYNTGFCKVYSLPVECMSIDMKMLLPFAAQVCMVAVVFLLYISSLKADKALGKNRISLTRIFWGEMLVFHFVLENQIVEIIGSWGSVILSYAVPILLEIMIYFRNKPRKNKVIPEKDRDEVLESTLRDAIFHNYYVKYGIAFFILPFVFTLYFGSITAQANRHYRIFSYNNNQYAVIIEYSDEVLVQPVEIEGNNLSIDTSEYCYFSKEGIVFSYRKFDDVTIGGSMNKVDAITSDQTESEATVLPSEEPQITQPEQETVATENSEQETE